LTPEVAMPSTKYLWQNMKMITVGIMALAEAAISWEVLEPSSKT
jgi:hypothetical protein